MTQPAHTDDELGCCGLPLPFTVPRQNGARSLLVVAAAVLLNDQKQVLLTQRPAGKSMAGLWEFPGGKLQEGEMPEYALVRELNEELGIVTCTDCLQPVQFISHDYGDMHVLMPLYAIRKWRGTPQGLEGQALKWVNKHELPLVDFVPADKVVIPFIQDLL